MNTFKIGSYGLLLCVAALSTAVLAKPEHRAEQNDRKRHKHIGVSLPTFSEADLTLQQIISDQNLVETIPDVSGLPHISEPIPQLGMKLFFAKSLGGEKTVACASCHHPRLGGADGLSLPIGTNALEPDVVGPLRVVNGEINIPRNSPTIFNSGLAESSLFWDGRVEKVTTTDNQGNEVSFISTPDSGFGQPDEKASSDLVSTLSRFPVTSVEEMRGSAFPNAQDNESVREHLAARLGNYGSGINDLEKNTWLQEFRKAFNSQQSAETLITFDSIAMALGQYQSSVKLVNTPWHKYLKGDLNALSENQKRGAHLFFTQISDGGAGCVNCHGGSRFSNDRFFNLAFPQFGIGLDNQNADVGRFAIDGQQQHMFAFRVPSLLNIELTAPYGHSGAYQSLEEVVAHYVNPENAIETFFANGGACGLAQFKDDPNCDTLNVNAVENSQAALALLQLSPFVAPPLDTEQQSDLVAFLKSLTDDCATSSRCVRRFEPGPRTFDPDNLRLRVQNALLGRI
ncbi:cytochrome-c peroxidase [Pseudoalteromonas luteoviolacea]|uniref:Cytochrome-c peroxidase n=1 Tax=Pseudoalteromonas luteoviolacea TaxID=43657 RepID=A0A1C0TJ65_9GAMM|nr:cytochrome c peroxidase [Pseudoalteromonas luteoviolacea]OCQ18312.1 cytochrome-c peroxidase [Pseudoalteromonas luteoviolacea]